MTEILLPHKIECPDPETQDGRYVTTYSPTYWGGLDPFSDVPEKYTLNSAEFLQFAQQLKERLGVLAGSSCTQSDNESFSLSINRNFLDFEGRTCDVMVQADFDKPSTPDVEFGLIQDTYYIYPNGIGIYKKIDHQAIFDPDMGRILEDTVLYERFLEPVDLITMRFIYSLLNR